MMTQDPPEFDKLDALRRRRDTLRRDLDKVEQEWQRALVAAARVAPKTVVADRAGVARSWLYTLISRKDKTP